MQRYSSVNTITQLLHQQAMLYGDRNYLVDAPNNRKLSYMEYNSLTNQVSLTMSGDGVRKGSFVSLVLENSPMYNIITHGVQKAGAAAVLVNTGLLPQDVLFIVENSNSDMVITDNKNEYLTALVKEKYPDKTMLLSDDIKLSADYIEFSNVPLPNVQPNDGALVLYTSGTTGRSKGALLTNLNVTHNAQVMARHNGLYQKIGLNIQPPFYTDGQILMMLSTLSSGGRIVQQDFDTKTFWKSVEKYSTQFSAVMPTNLSMLINDKQDSSNDMSSMEFLLCSAASLSPSIQEEFERTFNIPIVEGYGLTEAGSYSTCNLPTRMFKAGQSDEYRIIGSVGKAIGNDMKIVDSETLKKTGVGNIGEILIRGPNIMKGYINNPQATAETIIDGWLRTGDLGMVDDEGNYYIKGRRKDTVVYGGQKVFAREVEDALYANPKVKQVAIIPVPHWIMGEEVKALVVLREGVTTTEQELMEYCNQTLADWKRPRHIQFIDSMPLSSSGKILKRQLIELYGN